MVGSQASASSPAILIHLPSGPETFMPSTSASHLQTRLPIPVVQINYRCSVEHPYPTPIHDVLAGYDWILEHLLPHRSISRRGRSEIVGKLGVYGEYLGGSLATMLALTECRIGQPGIIAAAVRNPIMDWIELDGANTSAKTKRPTATKKSRGRKGAKADADPETELLQKESLDMQQALLRTRDEIFVKPEHYFDLFASPMLFFRSAGVEPPVHIPKKAGFDLDDIEQLNLLDSADFHRQQLALSALSSPPPSPPPISPVAGAGSPKRKASKRFPAASLKLQLPSFHIQANPFAPFGGQAIEFVKHLQQSYAREKTSAADQFGRKVLNEDEMQNEAEPDEEDDGRIVLQSTRRRGGHADFAVEETAAWFRDKLDV